MLKNTNEIHSIIWSICYALGMAVGGIATHFMGFDTAFLIDALLYGIAALLLLGLHLSLEKVHNSDSNWQMFKDGFNYLISHKKLLHLNLPVLMHSLPFLQTSNTKNSSLYLLLLVG